jgi:deazaflavin-dependent oxidoreductase (nitroreductase family)
MAYLKPPFFVRRVFNPLAMRFGIGGTVTVLVPGRKSGTLRRVPVIPVEHAGQLYLVSTRGESDWVRNLRAAGGGELRGKMVKGPFRAIEVPVEERPPIINSYRKAAGKTVEQYFKKLPDPADHPVFRIALDG